MEYWSDRGGIWVRVTKLPYYYCITNVESRHSRDYQNTGRMTHSPTHPPSHECELTFRANLRVREHPLHQSSERSLVEWLGEHVRQHIFRGDVLEHDIAFSMCSLTKQSRMKMCLDRLKRPPPLVCMCMADWLSCHVSIGQASL